MEYKSKFPVESRTIIHVTWALLKSDEMLCCTLRRCFEQDGKRADLGVKLCD